MLLPPRLLGALPPSFEASGRAGICHLSHCSPIQKFRLFAKRSLFFRSLHFQLILQNEFHARDFGALLCEGLVRCELRRLKLLQFHVTHRLESIAKLAVLSFQPKKVVCHSM